MAAPKIGIQVRMWGIDRIAAEYPQIFDEAEQAGYEGLECRASLLLEQEEELKGYFAGRRIRLAAMHTGLGNYAPDSDDPIDLDLLLDKMNRMNIRHLLVSFGKRDEYSRWFELAGKVAERCRKQNVEFCYHNHDFEFESSTDFFHELTRTYHVPLAADLAWVWRAGQDVNQFVDRHQDYIKYVHVKDTTKADWRELGRGEVPLQAVLEKVKTLDLPWWTVEQDTTDKVPAESAKISRSFLTNAIGV